MSSTVQETSSTSSTSNIQLITDALVDYEKITGIHLSKNPFAAAIKQEDSSEAILELLQEREKEFKDYRRGNRRLINYLSPAVNIIQAFSGILGAAVRLVPFPPAKALFVGIDVLLAAASGVTSSYDALLDLFESLGSFLNRLEVYTTIPPTPMMTDLITKIIVELLSVLALATKQIKQGRFKKFMKKLWMNKKDKIQAALERLDRLTKDEGLSTVAQILGVVHGIAEDRRVVMGDGEVPTGGVGQNPASNEINEMKRDQLQKDVRHWLSPPDPSTNQNFISKTRHKGTAAWFFESSALKEWKAKGSFLWIYGKPGAGKSTLLSAIIQDVEGIHAAGLAAMAYYYFDFRDIKKQDCYGLLSSLVWQLSAESDSCHNVLSKLYSDNGCGMREPNIDALKKCLADMLSLARQGQFYIIVDALDECPNFPGRPSAREKVLDLIEELVHLKLPDVHLCVASRPEMDIRIVLESLTSLKISLHDENGQKEDILDYIKSVVHSDRNMRRWREEDQNLVIDTLSKNVNGMFQWVVCQFDRLCRTFPASIRSVLKDLPESLDKTYEQTLLGIDKEKRVYAQRLFKCLSESIRPLRVEELGEIFAVQFEAMATPSFNEKFRPPDAEEALISACTSLIAIVNREGQQIVQFSHFSVKEYLTSERLTAAEERISYYHILPGPAHTILAHISLSILLHLDDEIDRDSIAHFPLAPYAARHWVDHAQFRNVSSHIKEVMKRLFDPAKPHFAAWVWVYDIDRYWMERIPTMHPTQPEAVPLYYASLCGFVGLSEHLIAAHPCDVNSEGGFHTTPLHAASVKGHLKVASLLLENGADPDSRDHLGRVPLHRVSQGGQLVMAKTSLEIAQLLVNSGADVNATDDKGCAPLHAAAESGYRDIAELLLGSGASLDARNKKQETPLELSCLHGKPDMAQLLIDRGSDINSRDDIDSTPLHSASQFGYVDVARLLLDCGSDVNAQKEDRWTPLHQALRYGYLDLARLLIDRGADVNAQKKDRWTPLHQASRYGYLDLARLLIDRGADVNAQEELSWTSLHDASSSGHFDIAKLLINHGANVDSWNAKQETPLDLASAFGHTKISRFLIESGAAVSTRDDNGWTPFHKASYYGHVHVTKLLLECGIDVDIRNGNEQTSLHLASMSGKLGVVRFLIDEGADIHIRDNNNSNPLHIASQNGHLDVVQLIINTGTPVDVRNGSQKTPLALASSEGKVEVVRFLIHQGADLNVRDNQSQAPLHLASQHGHLDMARLLLDHGVDPNIKRDDLSSALHLASANGHLKVADLLVQRGASVGVSNDKQETPLYQAVSNGNAAIARHLIDHGATVHIVDSNGWTVLHAASRRGDLRVVKLLLRSGADVDVLNKAGRSAGELASENGQAEVAKFISEYKANPNTRNKVLSATLDTVEYGPAKDEAKVLLHSAAEEGNIDTVKSLLDRGVDINVRGANNETLLDRAAAKGNVNVVRLLIERGAEVDSRDKWGNTPLIWSSHASHPEVLRVLLDHGADMNAREQNNWTPMHISTGRGHLEIVKLLLERGADTYAMDADGRTPYQLSLRRGNREIADLLRTRGAGRLGESP